MSTPPPAPAQVPELLLVHGDERYLVDRDARAWLARARAACASELNVEVIDAPAKLDPLRRSLLEVPFLDDRRFVLVRDPPQLAERARRGADSSEALAAALASRSPTTSVLLVGHLTVAPANPALRALRELGGRVVHHASPRGRQRRAWLEQRLAERGLSLPRGAADHLLRVAGGDLGGLENELDKLVAFQSGTGSPPSLEAVRRLAGGDEDLAVWDVLERLLSASPGEGVAAAEAVLGAGRPVQHLVTALAGQLRELLIAHETLAERPSGSTSLAHEMGIPPWRAERLHRQVRATTPERVEEWLRALAWLDAEVKQGRLNDADALRSMLLRAALAVRAAPAAG